jgi:hypothetical protein
MKFWIDVLEQIEAMARNSPSEAAGVTAEQALQEIEAMAAAALGKDQPVPSREWSSGQWQFWAPDDRFWHAGDRTWWRSHRGRLVRANPPSDKGEWCCARCSVAITDARVPLCEPCTKAVTPQPDDLAP